MSIKGFTEHNNNIETPNDINVAEKPLNTKQIKSQRVDINILKSKLEEEQSKEFRKNVLIFSFCVLILGSVGIYLSL
tara:strand:+ start:206 stop:436 length:231 start_codon:yes stop_codon:yes gene_type:complete